MRSNTVKADCRVDVRVSRFGFKKASYFKALPDASDFEKKPHKIKYGFSFHNFFHTLENAFGLPNGVFVYSARYAVFASLIAFEKTFALGMPALGGVFFALAITLDGSVVSNNTTDTNSITVASNSNRMLIVTFGTYQGSDPSGITHAGNAMTELVDAIGSFGESSSLWGRVAPATGANNVVVSGASNYRGVSIYSLYDCDQTLPATTTEAGGDSGSSSLSITPPVDNCWIIWSVESEAVPTMTTTSGVSDAVQEGDVYQHCAASHFVQTTAAAKAGTYTYSYGARWNMCACAVKPVASAAAPIPRRAYIYPNIPVKRAASY